MDDPITGKPIYFTPEADDEIIRDAVSNKLDRSLVNTQKESLKRLNSKQKYNLTQSDFDSLRYPNDRHNKMVDLVDINTNYPDSMKYIIVLSKRKTRIVTKEFLKSRNVTYIESIPIYSEDYINESKNLTQEKVTIFFFQK